MIIISNLALTVSDGSTIASTEVYGTDKKTYINIGSGNVFKLSWTAPTLANDSVGYYKLVIKRHDTTLNAYYDIFDKNIGLVNEFYVDSVLLPTLPLQYMLSIYVVACGKQGSIATSNIVNPYISKGTGTYVKVQPEGYKQPVMKRALTFVNAPVTDSIIPAIILDKDGNTAPILDDEGNEIPLTATNILTSSGWNVALEQYAKDSEAWQTSDIRYEVLVDKDGYTITDNSDELIYTL